MSTVTMLTGFEFISVEPNNSFRTARELPRLSRLLNFPYWISELCLPCVVRGQLLTITNTIKVLQYNEINTLHISFMSLYNINSHFYDISSSGVTKLLTHFSPREQ